MVNHDNIKYCFQKSRTGGIFTSEIIFLCHEISVKMPSFLRVGTLFDILCIKALSIHLQKTKSVRGCARKLQPDVRYADTLPLAPFWYLRLYLCWDRSFDFSCFSRFWGYFHCLSFFWTRYSISILFSLFGYYYPLYIDRTAFATWYFNKLS